MGLLSITRGKGTGTRREAAFDAAGAAVGRLPYGTEVNDTLNDLENFDMAHPYLTGAALATLADATTNDFDSSQAMWEVALDVDDGAAWAEFAEEFPLTELPANVGDMFFDTIAGTAEMAQEPLEDDDLDLGYIFLEGVELGAELFEQPFEYLGDPSEPINNARNGEVPVGDDTEVYNQDLVSYVRDTLGMDPNPESVSNGGEQASNQTTEPVNSTQTEQATTATPDSYEDFAEGLQNQDAESLGYLEGALEADPGLVDNVRIREDGIYIDSIVAEWSEMDDSMEQYLKNTAEDGDLAEALSEYERDRL